MLMKNSGESNEGKEFFLNLIKNSQEKIVVGLYLQLREHKDHFSMMQNRYRALTSTWLIAAFAGMGVLLSGHSNIALPFNVLLGVILLCLCSGFGVTLLWFLDIVLYQRFWIATVVEMARIEDKNPWIAPTNLHILRIRKNKKYRIFCSYFYIWINGLLLSVAGIAAGYYFQGNLTIVAVTILVVAFMICVSSFYILKKSGELDSITLQSFR